MTHNNSCNPHGHKQRDLETFWTDLRQGIDQVRCSVYRDTNSTYTVSSDTVNSDTVSTYTVSSDTVSD